MYHTLEALIEFTVDLEISPLQRLERLCLHEGTRVRAQIRPYVVETEDGPVEVADLYFEDGTVTRRVPFSRFRFVELP
jgi:hypothetical protein